MNRIKSITRLKTQDMSENCVGEGQQSKDDTFKARLWTIEDSLMGLFQWGNAHSVQNRLTSTKSSPVTCTQIQINLV